MPYQIVDAGQVEAVNGVFKPLRQPLGVSAFGINQLELPAGAEGPEHDHGGDGQEEVYAIVRGSGTIRVEGEERELAPGQFVFLAPGTSRAVVVPDIGIEAPAPEIGVAPTTSRLSAEPALAPPVEIFCVGAD